MTVLIASTMSDSGKSTITAGLVRLLKAEPFKAQNMSLNSYPTEDDGEIAFIQAYQAMGNGLKPQRYMNPILLKPSSKGIEVVFMGRPKGVYKASEYYERIGEFWKEVRELVKSDMVIESAGGIEPNFLDRDITLVKIVKEFNIPIILVLDIDRGGAFTSALGAYYTLPPSIRGNLKGFIINKLRGDEKLVEPAIKWLKERTGMKYLGYLPYFDTPLIMPEDSMNVYNIGEGEIEVSVIAYPYMSNFNEFNAFMKANVIVKFVKKPREAEKSDVIILPGSKDTLASLKWLLEKGFYELLKKKPVIGICGGFQIMGKEMIDVGGLETGSEITGLGFFNIRTVYESEKVTTLSVTDNGIKGYEIRRGRIDYLGEKPLFTIIRRGNKEVNIPDGAFKGNKLGFSIHGTLYSESGKKLLNELFGIKINSGTLEEEIQEEVSRVARILKQYVDVETISSLFT